MTDGSDPDQYLQFREAVQALDTGNVERLQQLLDEHPWLVRYKCYTGEPYEEDAHRAKRAARSEEHVRRDGPGPGPLVSLQ